MQKFKSLALETAEAQENFAPRYMSMLKKNQLSAMSGTSPTLDVFLHSENQEAPFIHLLDEMSREVSLELPLLRAPELWIKGGRGVGRRRGRPRGTGHPKRKLVCPVLFTETDYSTLKEKGLSDKELRTLFLLLEYGKQRSVAKELRITPQAVHKRLQKICRKLWGKSSKLRYQNLVRCVREINPQN